MTNILADLPEPIEGAELADSEVFTTLLQRPGIRIERIVSRGQTTPPDKLYDQDHDEWVLLLAGGARLWLDGTGERALQPGDTVFIAAHVRHRVTWTQAQPPTVWLAVHLEGA